MCYLNLGELDKSKEYFHRTIQLSRNQDAYEKLASIFAIENNFKNATSILISASKFVILILQNIEYKLMFIVIPLIKTKYHTYLLLNFKLN